MVTMATYYTRIHKGGGVTHPHVPSINYSNMVLTPWNVSKRFDNTPTVCCLILSLMIRRNARMENYRDQSDKRLRRCLQRNTTRFLRLPVEERRYDSTAGRALILLQEELSIHLHRSNRNTIFASLRQFVLHIRTSYYQSAWLNGRRGEEVVLQSFQTYDAIPSALAMESAPRLHLLFKTYQMTIAKERSSSTWSWNRNRQKHNNGR